jgi:hypothetical protein
MFLIKQKHGAFVILFFLATTVVGCGEFDLETQLVEENAEERVSLPPEVEDAIELGKDEVEVPITTSEEGVAKPSSFSKIYIIDYEDDSAPVREAPAPPQDSTTCGSSSAFSVKNFKWKVFPISYSISTQNLTDGVDPVAAKTAIVNAFNIWDAEERPVGDLFVEAKDSETPKMTVRWGSIAGKKKPLAITANTFNKATKIIISSQLIFNTSYIWKVFPAFDCKRQGSEFDIENVAAHEVGHAIGLLHPPNKHRNKPLTLYAFSSPGETLRRTLDKGDQFGIAKLYPVKKK